MLLKFIVFTLIALNPFVCSAAFSDNLHQRKSQPSSASKSGFTNLVCFMKTANGTTIDLSKLCNYNPKTQPNTNLARRAKKYDYTKIEEFNRRVYGE